jgi:hypothetical protein
LAILIEWILKKACQVFNNSIQKSRLRGRPKNRWWNHVQTVLINAKLQNWKKRSNNRAAWEKSIGGEGLHWTVVASKKKKKKKKRKEKKRKKRRRRKEEK